MEGFNPDQSLLPSVGGNITPMSGGGQEGGLTVNGVTTILGLKEEDFKKPEYETVLKAIAPNQIGNTTINEYWNTKKDSVEDDEVLKGNVLDTILSRPDYIKNLKFLIESETPLKDEDMPDIIKSLQTSIDLKNVTITLNDTELKVVIKMPSTAPVPAPAPAPAPVPATQKPFTLPIRETAWNTILATTKIKDIKSDHVDHFLNVIESYFKDINNTKDAILQKMDALDYTQFMPPGTDADVIKEIGGRSKRVLKAVITEVLAPLGIV